MKSALQIPLLAVDRGARAARRPRVWFTVCIAAWAGCLAAAGAAHKPIDSTVRISSIPAGAFVRLCPEGEFRSDCAVSLGKTPLMRLLPLTDEGGTVQISRPGYEIWQGKLSPAAPEIKAELTPLSDSRKKELGWFVSPPVRRLVVVPMRLGIRKTGSKTEAFDVSGSAADFTNRFLTAFETVIHERFGQRAAFAVPAELGSEDFWQQLARQMQGVHIPTIGFTPVPRRLDFTGEANASLATLDAAVLLVRAEAYYIGGGTVFAHVAIPLLLTAGSAYGGYSAAHATGASFYTYGVYGAPASSDVILVQMFLVHSQTRELMWCGQATMPQYFKHKQVTEKTASTAAEQAPAALLEKP